MCAQVLADSLGASLISIWAFSSDKSTGVVLASAGVLQKQQPQGFCVPVCPYGSAATCVVAAVAVDEGAAVLQPAVEPGGGTSLQRVIAREAPLTWSCEDANPLAASDLRQLAAATGVHHCAVLPLRYGGVLAGALQICLGGAPPPWSGPGGSASGTGGGGGGGSATGTPVVSIPDTSQLVDPGGTPPSPTTPLSPAGGRMPAGGAGAAAGGQDAEAGGAAAAEPAAGPEVFLGADGRGSSISPAAAPVPNWLPDHLADLMLLSPSAAALGGAPACDVSSRAHAPGAVGRDGASGGSYFASAAGSLAAAKPVPQAIVDLISTLRGCDTISRLITALMLGLQDLTYRVTFMPFTATPMLLHRSGTTAAIFQDVTPPGAGQPGIGPAAAVAAVAAGAWGGGSGAGGAAGTRSEAECESRGWTGALPSSFTSSPPQHVEMEPSRTVKAHLTHLNHTLMLQLVTGVDNNRYRKLYGGAIIQNCSEYMQDESNRGRDVSLCHRVGVADTGSLLLAASPAAGGSPLLATYLTSKEPLPEPLLESALAVVQQALKLSLTVISSLLVGGDLSDEWATLHDLHLNPTSVAVSTSCTPRSIVRTNLKDGPGQPGQQGGGAGGAGAGGQPPSGAQGFVAGAASGSLNQANSLPLTGQGNSAIAAAVEEAGLAVTAHSTTSMRRNLSFPIAVSSAAAPRSNLGMMVSSIRSSLNQVLSQRAALEAEGLQDDVNGVELLKQIGQGGQGVVFCGTLHGLEVAIKVVGTEEGADEVYDIDDEGQMIKLKRVLKRDATELAVTTSISHPNIVQVFSYFVDVMVVEYVGQPDRFKLLPKAKGHTATGGSADGGGVTGPSNMIICMEYCDAGSLKQAVKRGCFRTEAARPNMQALYTTLMEIALALRHLHALRLVHCDLKPSNILLKSSMRDPRGWVCKLSDFGCVRLMSEPAPGQRPSFNLEYAVGTPSFMAPEMFCKGHPLDAAVDIYSFGILMWEVYTGNTVYDGVPPDKLPYHVVKRGLRPAFPPEAPSAFRSLAQACWASEPRSRPTAAALVTVLQRLLSSSVSMAAPGLPAGPHGARPGG